MKEIIIKENDTNQRLDKFLTKSFKNLPKPLMYKAIRKKDIKINKKRCLPNDILKINDVVSLYIKDELLQNNEFNQYDFLKAPSNVDIVYEDKNILLVNKKPGLLSHPDETYHFDSLISRVQHYMYDKGEFEPNCENSFTPALANRIDRNTGGIVIVAKNAASLRILNDKIKHREIKKFYLCIVCGTFDKKQGTLSAYLEKNESQNRVYISSKSTKNSKIIKTKYTVIDECRHFSLLDVELLTGRTHQIRAHMAYVGHPLLGDGKYGKNAQNKRFGYKYQALYSYKLKFCFETPTSSLDYLNGKTFVAPKVWFVDDFYKNLSSYKNM